jgi:stage V sporulation protein R
MCEKPTAEDREWFPDIAGREDWRQVLRTAWANFRDESFILQYLSPKVIRDFRLFCVRDEADNPFYTISAIHDERGYRRVRETLAQSCDIGVLEPDIQVTAADLSGDRVLVLTHRMHRGVPLAETAREHVLKHVGRLWGHDVRLESVSDEKPA